MAKRVRQTDARGKVAIIQRNFSRLRPERIADQTFGGESLEIVTHAQAHGQSSRDTNRVLHEGRVLVGVRMRYRRAEILDVVTRHLVGVGAQGRQFQPIAHGFESPRIDRNRVVVILAAEHRREEVVNPGEQRVAAELPGVAALFETQRVGKMKTMFPRLPRKNSRATHAIEHVRDVRPDIGRVGARGLQIP